MVRCRLRVWFKKRGVWGRGRKEFRTEVQPSDQLLLGQPWVLVVAVAGGTMVQGAGKWHGMFLREGHRFDDF